MTIEEKHDLLLSCCRIVHQVAQRIETMAYSMATIRCNSHERAFDSGLDVIGPYTIAMIDSEDGLGIENPSAEEYDRTYRAMIDWLQERGIFPKPHEPISMRKPPEHA